MWLLDSNILSAFYNRADPAHERVVARGDAVGWSRIAIPVVVAAELLDGRIRYIEGAHHRSPEHLLEAYRRFAETHRSLTLLAAVPLDATALEIYRSGILSGRMARNDRLIAAMTLSGQHTLVTRNVAHFQSIPGLRVENWIDEPLPE